MSNPISRKEFLSSTTKTIVAVSAVAAGAGAIGVASGQLGQAGAVDKAAAAPPTWPCPYKPLDPETIRKSAHKFYYDGGCGYGAFNAIIGALQETVGEPFTEIPTQMLYFGSGGGAGWGTLCGALNGAAAAISLVVDRTNASADQRAVRVVHGGRSRATSATSTPHARCSWSTATPRLKQTQPGSPLCHASVSSWCTLAGYKASDPERAERCARLTGDVAARAVELLNRYSEGLQGGVRHAEGRQECHTCHSTATSATCSPA